jgi:hypothetical protein
MSNAGKLTQTESIASVREAAKSVQLGPLRAVEVKTAASATRAAKLAVETLRQEATK